MKRVALLAGLLAAVVLGCAKPAPKADEVVLWQPWDPAVLAPHVARFEGANPNLHVRVRQVPAAALGDSLAAALAAGTPPDLCVMDAEDMPGWLARGVFNDWSAGVADLRDSLAGWPWVQVGDALYGLPWLLDVRTLLRNDSLLARAGVKPAGAPATWADLRAAAARVERLGHGVHGIGLSRGDSVETAAGFLAFALGHGAELLSAGRDTAFMDSKPMREAMDFYGSLHRSALVAGRDTLEREFAAGRLAFLVAGASASGLAVNGATRSLLPRAAAGDTAAGSYAGGLVLASFTGAKKKEAALRLARALARPDVVREVAAGCGYQSAWRDSGATGSFGDAAALARFAPGVAHWDSIRATIGEQVGQALAGAVLPESALVAMQSRVAVLARMR